jgi:hypothetical protein
MPKRFIKSETPSAGIPPDLAALTASSRRTMPSVTENSEWRRKWIKEGKFIRAFYHSKAISPLKDEVDYFTL